MRCTGQIPVGYNYFEIKGRAKAKNKILLQPGKRRLQFWSNQIIVLEKVFVVQYLTGIAGIWKKFTCLLNGCRNGTFSLGPPFSKPWFSSYCLRAIEKHSLLNLAELIIIKLKKVINKSIDLKIKVIRATKLWSSPTGSCYKIIFSNEIRKRIYSLLRS